MMQVVNYELCNAMVCGVGVNSAFPPTVASLWPKAGDLITLIIILACMTATSNDSSHKIIQPVSKSSSSICLCDLLLLWIPEIADTMGKEGLYVILLLLNVLLINFSDCPLDPYIMGRGEEMEGLIGFHHFIYLNQVPSDT